MNCEGMGIKISAYVDKELSPAETREMEEHLKCCPECQRQFSEFSHLEEFRSFLAPEEVTEDKWHECWEGIKKKTTAILAASYIQKSLGEQRSSQMRRRLARFAVYATLAAVASCIALVVTGYLVTPPTSVSTDVDAQEASIIINDYDDANYTLLVDDNLDFAIIKLIPITKK